MKTDRSQSDPGDSMKRTDEMRHIKHRGAGKCYQDQDHCYAEDTVSYMIDKSETF